MERVKKSTEPEKLVAISDLEQVVETLRTNTERIQMLEKSWHESEWYLGEARARNTRLEDELRDKEHYIRKLEAECHQIKQQLAELTMPLEVKDRHLHLEPVPARVRIK